MYGIPMYRIPSRVALAVAIGLLFGSSAAQAQGFGIYEHDACAMGRAGTGVARPCHGGSAMFFNPAALGALPHRPTPSSDEELLDAMMNPPKEYRTVVSQGVTLIQPIGSFTDDIFGVKTDQEDKLLPVPNLYVTRRISEALSAGLGVFGAFGLETHWPLEFDGRFGGYDNLLQSIYFQPTLAYDFQGLASIGFGLDFVYSRVEIIQRVDLSTQTVPGVGTFAQLGIPPFTDFANTELDGNGTGWGFHVGVQIKLLPRFHLGARYLHKVTIDYNGDVEFTPVSTGLILPAGNPVTGIVTPVDSIVAASFGAGAALSNGDISTSITMPNILVLGFAWDVLNRFTLLGDYQYTWWNKFDVIDIDFANDATPDRTLVENYENTHGIRVGAEYMLSSSVTLRSGYIWHEAGAPEATVTPLLPGDGKRNEVTVGISFNVTDRLRTDLAYQFLGQEDRRGRLVEVPEPDYFRQGPEGPARVDGATLNSGVYDNYANLFGASFTFSF